MIDPGSGEYVVGVDGCPGGWVAVELRDTTWEPRIFSSFRELLDAHERAQQIGVDIPIGLTHGGVRACDKAARAMIKPRGSCVFNPPDPRILACKDHTEAMQMLRSLGQPGVSKQTIAIMGKIAEVNGAMTPELQERVFEVHPEVSFAELNGCPISIKKARLAGYEARANLLRTAMGLTIPGRRTLRRDVSGAKPDDVLDAIVAAWTARRASRGIARRLPIIPEKNAEGLKMEIVYKPRSRFREVAIASCSRDQLDVDCARSGERRFTVESMSNGSIIERRFDDTSTRPNARGLFDESFDRTETFSGRWL